jgi:hypothetical protein
VPNRLIRSGYLDSDRTNSLSDWADRIFFRLLLAADDAGRYDARLDIMRSRLLPLVSRRTNEYALALAEITERALAYEYEVEGKRYVQLMRVQRCGPSRVSKFPDWRGNYEIEYIGKQTPDGTKEFVLSSLPEGMPCLTDGEGLPKGSARDPGALDPPPKLSTETKTETKSNTKTKKARRSDEPPPGLVIPFESPEFMSTWERFVAHRAELRKPLKPTGAQTLLDDLGVLPEAEAIVRLRKAIANGWQGVLFDRPPAPRTTAESPVGGRQQSPVRRLSDPDAPPDVAAAREAMRNGAVSDEQLEIVREWLEGVA